MRFRWVLAGAGVGLLVLVFLPSSFKVRLYSGFDLRDETTRGRIEIFETGLRMVAANPLTGVGPRMVAAEVGIPALLVWLGLWLWIAYDLLGFRRRKREDPLASSLALMALCVIAAFHLMGLLEYNAGDSEVVTLMIFFVSAAYAVRRQEEGVDRAWHIR